MDPLTQLLALVELLLRFEGLKSRRIKPSTEHEFLMLVGLYFAKGKRKKSSLIDDLHLAPATGYRMIDRLKVQKLIEVDSDSTSAFVSLTQRGKKHVEIKLEEQGQRMSKLRLLWIGAEQRKKVKEVFEDLRSKLLELIQE